MFGATKSRAERHDWVMHNLELVQMAHATDKRPREISGGMKQRVGIARALAMEPKVLLLDEPFGALDALTRANLQDSVMEIHAKLGNTVLMITHDVDEAVLLSDRIVMMTNGPSATIGEILDVDLPRPRRRLELATDAEYARAARRCWSSSTPGIACRRALPEEGMTEFDDQQKQWLQGFVSGLEARKAADKLTNRSAATAAPSNLDALQTAAQDRARRGGRQAGRRGERQAQEASARPVGRGRGPRRGRAVPQGHRRLPVQVPGPVLRRAGAGRVHVPAALPRRHPDAPQFRGVADARRALRRRLRRRHHARQPADPRDRRGDTPSTC